MAKSPLIGVRLVGVLGLCALCGALCQAEQAWNAPYRLTVKVAAGRLDPQAVAVAYVPGSAGQGLADNDVAVRDRRGRAVPHEVVGRTISGLTCVAYAAGRAAGETCLYYPLAATAPRPTDEPSPWRPERGLFVRCFAASTSGANGELAGLRARFAAGDQPLAGDAWPTPCVTSDPFDLRVDVTTVFRGQFLVTVPGVHHFAIASLQASRLWIDEAIVVECPGLQRAPQEWRRECRFTAAVPLQPGVHRLEYAAAQPAGSADGFARVLWHRPNDPMNPRYGPVYANMPAESFGFAVPTSVVEIVREGARPAAGYDVVLVGAAHDEDLDLRVAELNAWPTPATSDKEYQWRLPGNVIARGKTVTCVTVGDVPLTAELRVGPDGQEDRCQKTIAPEDWTLRTAEAAALAPLVARGLQTLAAAETAAMEPAFRGRLIRMYKARGQWDQVRRHYAEVVNSWRAGRGASLSAETATLLVAAAAELRYNGDPRTAAGISQDLAATSSAWESALTQRVMVEAAICAALSGDAVASERASTLATSVSAAQQESRRGALSFSIRRACQARRFDKALALIDDFEAQHPLELLEGGSSVWRLDALIGKRDWRRAARVFESLEKLHPVLAHSPAVLPSAVAVYQGLGDESRARQFQQQADAWKQ